MRGHFPSFDFNHAFDDVIFFDVETQSAADLRQVGGRIYAANPKTRPLVTVFLVGGQLLVWVPRYLWPNSRVPPLPIRAMTPQGYGPVPPIELHIGDDMPPIDVSKVFVAHNLGDFDFHIANLFWPRSPAVGMTPCLLPEPRAIRVPLIYSVRRSWVSARIQAGSR